MQRIIVTGANGAGKTHFAKALHAARPDIPLIHFDALKLTRNWQQRPRAESASALQDAITQECWILEGGPSLLQTALPRAEAVIWLDPSNGLRAWRLALRPWRGIGRTRAELPDGNIDWPWQQYRFAWRSLKAAARFHDMIEGALAESDIPVWHCKTAQDQTRALEAWRQG